MPERRRCPLKPWGPFGGNGRGPRRKYFRWGNLGGTCRRGLNLTPMSGDGSPFQTRGRKARREGGGILIHSRDEKPVWSAFEHDARSERVLFRSGYKQKELAPENERLLWWSLLRRGFCGHIVLKDAPNECAPVSGSVTIGVFIRLRCPRGCGNIIQSLFHITIETGAEG